MNWYTKEQGFGRVFGGVSSRMAEKLASGRGGHGLLMLLLLLLQHGLACSPVAPAGQVPQAATTNAAAQQPSAAALPVEADDAVWGLPTAPVTLIAFLDFECPFCARGYATLTQMQAKYGPEQLRVVVKHAPLPFHQRGVPAARAAQVVLFSAGPDAFFRYMDELFDNSRRLSDANLRRWAADVGVAPETYASKLGAPETVSAVDNDTQLAASLGVDGVPAFYINGASIVGARPASDFETLIEHELRAASALLGQGTTPQQVYASRVKVNLRPPRQLDLANDQMAFVVPVGESPARGPSDAWVTIVEFADFECAYCRQIHPVIEALQQRYPGKVRWVMKHNPLGFHPLAVPAALLALEVYQQRGAQAYWTTLGQLFAEPRLTPKYLASVAYAQNLDAERYTATRALGEDHPRLIADGDLAEDLVARGTPHFFINGRRVTGAQPQAYFEQIVEEELRRVEGLIAAGADASDPYALVQQRALPAPGLVKLDVEPPDGSVPSRGPNDAPVVIQMFSDFECAYCRRVMPTLDELENRYPGKLRIVWRHLPLAFHRRARLAASAAIEVQAQKGDEAFWQMADRMLGHRGYALKPLERHSLEEFARELDVDMGRFATALDQGTHDGVVSRDLELATRLGIHGTPAFLVNGYHLSGAQPLRRFERLVRLALEQAEVDGEEQKRQL